MIAGFEMPDSGRVHVGGQDITDVPVHRRDMGMVFQSYALFPHRTVARERRLRPAHARRAAGPRSTRRVAAALAQVALTGLEDRRPGQLSGGQQQRVALARALVDRAARCCCATSRSARSTASCASRCSSS